MLDYDCVRCVKRERKKPHATNTNKEDRKLEDVLLITLGALPLRSGPSSECKGRCWWLTKLGRWSGSWKSGL